MTATGGPNQPTTTQPITFSFELFPPQTGDGAVKLWGHVEKLVALKPAYISVTCGADGGNRQGTVELVDRIRRETDVAPAAHLTCAGVSASEVDEVAEAYWERGVRSIVALRGDPADGAGEAYRPHPEGYAYASDLVAALKKAHDFDISVAAYPEVHPEATSAEADLDNLKRKVDAGANRAITQFFFDPDVYLRFRDRAVAAGITVPIVPGIFPVSNFKRTAGFAAKCGASVPGWMVQLFEGLEEDKETRSYLGASVAFETCRYLRDRGVDSFHIYTLNSAGIASAVCRMLRAPEIGCGFSNAAE
ncbi:MAG: methylenetetrahydrofolate reductase [NAD(P)H] [Magnetovibrionaceae bacterium]